MNTSRTVAIALWLVSASGCGPMEESASGPTDPRIQAGGISGPQVEGLQATLDDYVRSLMDRDVSALRQVVSSEVLARGADRGIGLDKFLEKQRASMLRTFALSDGEAPKLEVTEVQAAGDQVVRATLRFRGEPLKKEFYFVREQGALRLSIARPGFSTQGNSNYQLHNVNSGGDPVTMMCNPNNKTVGPRQTAKVSCKDSCGWWSGTLFQRLGGEIQRRCDWNSWGDDVIINFLSRDGWDCNDYC